LEEAEAEADAEAETDADTDPKTELWAEALAEAEAEAVMWEAEALEVPLALLVGAAAPLEACTVEALVVTCVCATRRACSKARVPCVLVVLRLLYPNVV
jgi:hypothetical protein